MFERFGEFDSAAELNLTAEGLKTEGDMESLLVLAEENGIDREDAKDYWEGDIDALTTPCGAAIGKIDVECKDLKPKQIMIDWVDYIRSQCLESEEMAAAVRKKGKSIKGCIGKLLEWSFKNQIPVEKDILKEAKVNAGRVTLGIPGMGEAKKIIRKYYTEA